jgi:hypothetical protein
VTRFNILAAIALVCAACGGHAAVKTTTFAGENGVAYDVHGQPLYLECTGQGAPTVVLEAGLGGDHFA